ncbi:hypothetical protein KAH27_01490 [bacterium]|nr:hypothetical protein [bacterium]
MIISLFDQAYAGLKGRKDVLRCKVIKKDVAAGEQSEPVESTSSCLARGYIVCINYLLIYHYELDMTLVYKTIIR